MMNADHGTENLLCLGRTAWALVVGTPHKLASC